VINRTPATGKATGYSYVQVITPAADPVCLNPLVLMIGMPLSAEFVLKAPPRNFGAVAKW
jgi:hypothetical protein